MVVGDIRDQKDEHNGELRCVMKGERTREWREGKGYKVKSYWWTKGLII